MQIAQCKECGQTVEIDAYLESLTQSFGVFCAPCLERMGASVTKGRVVRQYDAAFQRLCPPCFPDTELEKLPCRARSDTALAWQYGMKGLNLWGYPGTGKTRTMSLVLKREALAGRSVIALGPGSFREECEDRDYKRSRWLARLISVDILFLDDFDKQNLTRAMEKDLFSVLSSRMGHRPVMTTGNTKGADLERMFSLGAPMVDRIRRYCVNIHFGKEDLNGKE